MNKHRNTDKAHAASLKKLNAAARTDMSDSGAWARTAEHDPDKAYNLIVSALGYLPVGQPWSVFAPIYNEDTPDTVFLGVAEFADDIFTTAGIHKDDSIVDAACGTGAIARNLARRGYGTIFAFDNSPAMLEQANRLNARYPQIQTITASIESVQLPTTPKGMVWCDFSSNFALSEQTLKSWLQNLIDNLAPGGTLIFDVRTPTGWSVDFFKQKVTTFSTNNFQRIWINLPDYKKKLIRFDILIRLRQLNGQWGDWRREQMQERMWLLVDVRRIVQELRHAQLQSIYNDDFKPAGDTAEPGLVYFVLRKTL